jgi:hypothetical protein
MGSVAIPPDRVAPFINALLTCGPTSVDGLDAGELEPGPAVPGARRSHGPAVGLGTLLDDALVPLEFVLAFL